MDRRGLMGVGAIGIAAVAILAAAVTSAVVLTSGGGDTDGQAQAPSAGAADEATDFTTVQVQQYGLDPTRVEVSPGETVRWENTNLFAVEIVFERDELDTLTVSGGATAQKSFSSITDYEVRRADTGDILGRGTVYVK